MNWPSIVASATKAAGGANAKANEGKLTRPTPNSAGRTEIGDVIEHRGQNTEQDGAGKSEQPCADGHCRAEAEIDDCQGDQIRHEILLDIVRNANETKLGIPRREE